jgi:monofunctional biosynthetic peptidoglycan transglycosylase
MSDGGRFRLPVPPPDGSVSAAGTGRRILLWGATAAAALLVAADAGLPSPERVAALREAWPETTAYMELRRSEAAREGRELRIAWEPVPLSRVPNHLTRAVLVAEDAAFWGHHGFDPAELRVALEEAWRERRAPRGASTLTMQLARNLWLSPETTLWRKLREAILARRLETTLDKRRILELYLSVVELGPGVFGVQAASRAYWDVPVERIGPLQAVELAATLPSPLRNNPGTRTRAFRWRRDLIAARVQADTLEDVRAADPAIPGDTVEPSPDPGLPSLDTVPVPTGEERDTAAVDTVEADTVAEEALPDTVASDTSGATAGARLEADAGDPRVPRDALAFNGEDSG